MIEIKAPLLAEIAATGSCNLNCTYCYARGIPQQEMDYDFCTTLMTDLIHRGVFAIVLAGGEPFMHSRILDIVDFCSRFLGDRISLLSNGVCLANDHVFEEFGRITRLNHRRYHKKISIQISLDSLSPIKNDFFRGRTDDVIKAINRVADLPVNLCIGTVVTNANIREPPSIIKEFYPRIKLFHHMRLINCHGDDSLGGLVPDDLQILSLRRELLAMQSSLPELRLTGFTRGTGPSKIKYPGCLAGVTRLYINPAGKVLPCCMAVGNEWGNLHAQKFEDIWFSEAAERARNERVALCRIRTTESPT